ncbi:terminase large subunit [Salmonella phage 18-India]|nr:terminase large subunit [Salmonella phage 18-India]
MKVEANHFVNSKMLDKRLWALYTCPHRDQAENKVGYRLRGTCMEAQ